MSSLYAAHIDIFQFIQKSDFESNTCTANWAPLTGNYDSHQLIFLIWGWNHSVALSSYMWVPFVFTANFWATSSLLIYFTYFLDKNIYPVSNYICFFTLFTSSLCIILLTGIRMLNTPLFININGFAVSKCSKDLFPF